jgi:transcription termination/antitermination protein NusG
MYMQRRSDFLGSNRIEIRPYAMEKQAKAIRENEVHIRDIDLAGRRLVRDYPDLAGWFCLSVRNKQEFAVETLLSVHDIEACVPTRKGDKLAHRHGGTREPILPVIPGYILVKCVPSGSAFAGLRHIDPVKKRVTGIIGRGEIPYRIPAKYIEPFIELAAIGEYDWHPEEHGYDVGMEVRVTSGPFASFGALVTSIDLTAKEGRINVEVSIFGRSTPMELDISQIEKWDCRNPKTVGVIRSRKSR